MDKFEYLTVCYDESWLSYFDSFLNSYGEKGWELVSCIPKDPKDFFNLEGYLIFKRKAK
jgi:hypothetical protein